MGKKSRTKQNREKGGQRWEFEDDHFYYEDEPEVSMTRVLSLDKAFFCVEP